MLHRISTIADRMLPSKFAFSSVNPAATLPRFQETAEDPRTVRAKQFDKCIRKKKKKKQVKHLQH